MLPVYCMTGCDTVSSFHVHGKKSVFRIMTQKAEKYQGLSTLGSNVNISERKHVLPWHLSVSYMGTQTLCRLMSYDA